MTSHIAEGQKAPLFSLVNATGEVISLSDFSGQNVVVYFYPKDDTPGCTKEACGFRDLWDDYSTANTIVIGISPDRADSHQKFVEKYKLPFILLSDPDLKVMTMYGAYGEKMMYGKKVQGVIRSTVLVGKDGSVVKHWKRVPKAADHPAKVLEQIHRLG